MYALIYWSFRLFSHAHNYLSKIKMFKNKILLAACILSGSVAIAQTTPKKKTPVAKAPQVVTVAAPVVEDPIMLIVGGDAVTRAEFESIYRKNNSKDTASSRKALEEYLQLFINFKLKVKAAKVAGKDTAKAFQTELKGYRRQLAQPYLTDKNVNDKLIQEAYDRSKKDVKASHILISLSSESLPKDTLVAYTKAMKIRERLIKGEDFALLARQNSDDPSAKQNDGDLGYFTSMMMVYPFESAAYLTPIGEISAPVRTKFGYHILKVTNVRDAQGQVHVAHIMVKNPENAKDSIIAENKKKIDEINSKIKKGDDFGQLASQFSDDRSSGKNGGQLPWFGTGKMVPEFEKVAFDLKNDNDVSEPFRTPYGWHIVKRLERKGVQSFDEVKAELKSKISKDSRSQLSSDAVIARVKKENGFTEDFKALNEFILKVDTSFLSGRLKSEALKSMVKPLFVLGNEASTQYDFAEFLVQNQSRQAKDNNLESLVRKSYEYFKNEKIKAYEDVRLEQKYPEFRMLMQEYRDGIMLFEITDENVWSKALKDTLGLEEFHKQNLAKYMWSNRVEAVVYKSKDAKIAKATRKLVAKRAKKGTSIDAIRSEINESSKLNLQTEIGVFSKGDNETVDGVNWVLGISVDKVNADGSVTFVEITKVLEPTPKTLQEARGLITADYQTYLEQNWIKELRSKYPVEVKRDIFESIK
jgi:peptidyl-prolyl cis-trans isomerase SurA